MIKRLLIKENNIGFPSNMFAVTRFTFFIHNARYVAQLLVDSIQDLGGNIAPYTWR